MLAPVSITDEQKTRLRKLAWSTVSRLVLSAAGAVGAKLGEKAVEWLMGSDDTDDSDDDDDGDKPSDDGDRTA